ncbi:hypothetical protein PV05_12035 [Exophiala xenobiotica]|uniref:Xylanolytic transcriptional activator regulatory domain-containing protein n=1 Tax=Exophiala xenobiotica TaxID=348802 RepID=A0A0D2E4V9_9EURO|nr:uncharacterized protein PV05_12035 [Exophiala xenobiotica]KIW50448.1 hypothetical protein PV05_12035 [Exophiala xenobiotica]
MDPPLKTNRACDGERPQCQICIRNNENCVYPVRKARAHYKRRRKDGESQPAQDHVQEDVLTTGEAALSSTGQALSPQEEREPASLNQRPVAATVVDSLTDGHDVENTLVFSGGDHNLQFDCIDHDMSSFLTEAFPDVWNPDEGLTFDLGQPSLMNGPLEPATDSNHSDQTPKNTRGINIEVPTAVVDELIDLYFERVQSFLPLFHRTTFYDTYVNLPPHEKYVNLERDSAYVLYTMMSLSARYSSLPYLESAHARDHGIPFARQARALFGSATLADPAALTLRLLQGTILFAYYNQSSNLSWGTDILIGVCVRYAYKLGLHALDEDYLNSSEQSPIHLRTEQWILREEKRRAWWSVWELDTFDAIICRRPFAIARHRIHVLLPVSDAAWFSGSQIASPMFDPDISRCWKCLEDSPNQDERAWFLVSNYIMAYMHEQGQKAPSPKPNIEEMRTILACFVLLADEKLRRPVDYSVETSNWRILMKLMTISSTLILGLLEGNTLSTPVFTGSNRMSSTLLQGSIARGHSSTSGSLDKFRELMAQFFWTLRSWHPEHIAYAPPTMACLILGPGNMSLRMAIRSRKPTDTHSTGAQSSLEEDLLTLILTHFARYWNIGHHILKFVRNYYAKHSGVDQERQA